MRPGLRIRFGSKLSLTRAVSAANGAGCGSNSIEFHPTVVALFDTFIANHAPWCVELLADDEIFTDGFESGDTNAWI